MDATKSLEALGTVTGMSLPLVLFPTAVINAMSTILLPTISEKQAQKNKNGILHLLKKTTWYSFLIGVVCALFFYIFGNPLGSFIYKNSEAGFYIKSLSVICPFLFINITLASVMNGFIRLCQPFRYLAILPDLLAENLSVPSSVSALLCIF